MALNPSPATNNLLALVASVAATGRGDGGYVDTGEPAPVVVTTTSSSIPKNFPVNTQLGAVQASPVTRGAYGLIIGNITGTVGPIFIQAQFNNGNVETLDAFPLLTPNQGVCIIRPFTSSSAAGSDAQNSLSGGQGYIQAVQVVMTLTTASTMTVRFCAVGQP